MTIGRQIIFVHPNRLSPSPLSFSLVDTSITAKGRAVLAAALGRTELRSLEWVCGSFFILACVNHHFLAALNQFQEKGDE
jgi:hypothetical protein